MSTIFYVLSYIFFFSCVIRLRHRNHNKEKETAEAVSIRLLESNAVALLEAIHTAASVHQLLLAGKERVALGANFNAQLLLRRARHEGIAANTGHGRLLILRMNAFLHDFHLFRRDTIA